MMYDMLVCRKALIIAVYKARLSLPLSVHLQPPFSAAANVRLYRAPRLCLLLEDEILYRSTFENRSNGGRAGRGGGYASVLCTLQQVLPVLLFVKSAQTPTTEYRLFTGTVVPRVTQQHTTHPTPLTDLTGS